MTFHCKGGFGRLSRGLLTNLQRVHLSFRVPLRGSLHCGDALQFDGNGGWKPVDFHCRPARLVVLEVLGVQAIERVEIAVHVHEENGDVDELFPAAAAGLEDGFDVGEHAVDLRFKIKGFEVAVVVQFQSWNATII